MIDWEEVHVAESITDCEHDGNSLGLIKLIPAWRHLDLSSTAATAVAAAEAARLTEMRRCLIKDALTTSKL